MSALKDMTKLCGVIVATAKLIDADYPAILVYLIITLPILLTFTLCYFHITDEGESSTDEQVIRMESKYDADENSREKRTQ